jgi:glyoxylase-like metal-dependent hydrolase (beta-lactamase superfamily II)
MPSLKSPLSKDYGHGVHLIDAQYRRRGLAALYLVIEGNQAAFIDTGTARSLPGALDVLKTLGIPVESVAYVIPTHVHLDHAGGAGAMIQAFPNARLVVHPRGARHLVDPGKLIAGVTQVYGPEETARSFGTIVPIPVERVIEAPDLFSLNLGGRELVFLDTPGHARHHFCIWDKQSGSMFTGDTFGLSYREFDTDKGAFIFPTTTPVQFEPDALHASIDRIRDHHPRQVLLTHYGRVTEIERLARDLHELIDAFVDMAVKANNAGGDRHTLLVQGQREILLARLQKHGCLLDTTQIDTLLGGDYELNAQGIGVWLDRQSTQQPAP